LHEFKTFFFEYSKVAVKVINKREVLKRNYLRANLRREACMMQRMQHPHIIQLFEVMETENCYYIVMELIDGIEFVKYLSKKYTPFFSFCLSSN
jgi:serine/threonine protein kinase